MEKVKKGKRWAVIDKEGEVLKDELSVAESNCWDDCKVGMEEQESNFLKSIITVKYEWLIIDRHKLQDWLDETSSETDLGSFRRALGRGFRWVTAESLAGYGAEQLVDEMIHSNISWR